MSTLTDLSGKTTLVVGASRGLGRGIVASFAGGGARVVAISRSPAGFAEPANGTRTIQHEVADATAATAPASLLDRYEPDVVVLVAGATPHMRPLRQQTWETFSVNWESDVRMTFNWVREILLKPLRPGSRVVVLSSGAMLHGSPLSGGYAGAKATQRFISAYAQDEAKSAGLGITFTAVLPRFAPQTAVGRLAVQAYAARAGQSVEQYLESFVQSTGPVVTPEVAGTALVKLVTQDPGSLSLAYLLTGDGLKPLP